MKYYEAILELKCFSVSELAQYVGNKESTIYSLLRDYIKKGLVRQVRRNLYVAVSLETGEPVANPYQIATKLTATSYVSHRTAFTYYGYIDQVSYEMFISTDSRFRNFEFDEMDYCCIMSKCNLGISEMQGVRVANIERAVIDYINQFDHIGGLEELLKGLAMIPFLSEDKLMTYLEFYGKSFLYQKTGYLLEHFQKELKLSDTFVVKCMEKKSKSIRYFTESFPKDKLVYNGKWGLMVPYKLLHISD
ncbi:MAG: helix-turn-helix domain-containing protein [Eubacteriales bacterium]